MHVKPRKDLTVRSFGAKGHTSRTRLKQIYETHLVCTKESSVPESSIQSHTEIVSGNGREESGSKQNDDTRKPGPVITQTPQGVLRGQV